MAIVLMEGFDHLSVSQMTIKGWSAAFNSTVAGARISGQSMNTGNSPHIKVLPSTYSTLIAGFGLFATTIGVASDFFQFRGGGGNVARLRAVTSGPNSVLQVLNSSGTVLGTGTTPLMGNTWYYIEIKCVVSATVGVIEVRLNGLASAEISATGLNTGSTNLDSINLAQMGNSTTSFDDLYVVDTSGSAPTNDFLGDCRVETLPPTGNGANTAWTGVYTDWDDSTSHNTDTDYVSSSTPGDRETSTLADLAVGTGTVFAVQTNLVARKDDAGARTIAPVIRIGGVDYDGTTTAGLSTSYIDYTQLYDRLDPSGSAWSIATVNGMEAGVKEVA